MNFTSTKYLHKPIKQTENLAQTIDQDSVNTCLHSRNEEPEYLNIMSRTNP